GGLIGVAGIFVAYRLWIVSPERPAAIQARFRALHTFFVNKWYFHEGIDFLIVRPAARLRPLCASTFEPVFLHRAPVRGSSGRARRRLERARRRAVRRRARGPVGLPALLRRAVAGGPDRPERLLPDLRMSVSLTILIFFPLALGLLAAMSPPGLAPWVGLLGT